MKKINAFLFLILMSSLSSAADLDEIINKTNEAHSKVNQSSTQQKIKVFVSQDSSGNHRVKQTAEHRVSTSDGSGAKVGGVLDKVADKTAASKTLSDRLKKAKDYAAKAGRTSIPVFVGGAALGKLIEGIGWVMDEGGKVTKHTGGSIDGYIYTDSHLNDPSKWTVASYDHVEACKAILALGGKTYKGSTPYPNTTCYYDYYGDWRIASMHAHPDNSPPQVAEVQPAELEQAVKNALESNNPALAAAISEAIKSAYSPDNSPGQDASTNTLAKEGAEKINDAVNKAAEHTATNTNTDNKPGYYKITDPATGETVEGYIYPANPQATGQTESTTTPQADGTTITEGTNTFNFPPFCDWAGIVCEWIGWTQEEPFLEDVELPEYELERQEIDEDLLSVNGTSCPNDITVNWNNLPFGISINKTVAMQPYCTELRPLKYVFYLITVCLCAFMFVRL